ncbi:MAG: COR domain-containing protein, partial [Pseudomonadota bacterium]
GHGCDSWLDRLERALSATPIDAELELAWVDISEERLSQSPAEVNAYLKQLRDEILARRAGAEATLQPLNRVRTIFIGPGAAGKTSLIRALHGEDVVEGDQEQTHGTDLTESGRIEIEAAADIFELEHPDAGITVHFWDFGGQVMAHATHQFFLRSRCLYVLVLDCADERAGRERRNADAEAEYWLEHVKAYGDSSPVMIVGGKCDLKHKVNVDLSRLQRKFPNVVGFYPVSATGAKSDYKPEFDSFVRDWVKQLIKLGVHAEMFSRAQFQVMERIKEAAETHDFLPFNEYEKICDEAGLEMEGPAGGQTLRDLLDKLGVIMHFPELDLLDADLLNPRWLTYGVYTILFSELCYEAGGRLKTGDVVKILETPPLPAGTNRPVVYSRSRCRIIIDAMKAFKVAYEPQPGHIIVPARLPENEPPHEFDYDGALAFQFDFKGILPRHVLPALIVDRHKEIKRLKAGRRKIDAVWEYGVILSPQWGLNAEAVVYADAHSEKKLDIRVKGNDASTYLNLLRQCVLDAVHEMRGLDFEENIRVIPQMRTDAELRRVPGGAPHWVPYDNILTAQEAGEPKFPGKDRTYYDTEKVMRIFPAVSHSPGHQIMISYSHKERKIVDALAKSVEDLGYRVWYDKSLNAASPEGFRDQIVRAIETASAVLVLWTGASVRSKWVRSEADMASDGRKLIGLKVKTRKLPKIPPPFGEDHILDHTDVEGLTRAFQTLKIRRRL